MHESHLTRLFSFTVIPADLAVGAGSCCQNINKRDYIYNDSLLLGFSVQVKSECCIWEPLFNETTSVEVCLIEIEVERLK